MGKPRFHKKIQNENRARNNADKSLKQLRQVQDTLPQPPARIGRFFTSVTRHPEDDLRQFAQNGTRFSEFHKDTDPVPYVNRYSPYRDVAAAECGVPYGVVGVADRLDHIVSHEIRVDSMDSTCYLSDYQREQDRRAWTQYVAEKQAKEEALAHELQSALAESGI